MTPVPLMRHAALLIALVALSACGQDAQTRKALKAAEEVDQNNMADIMLNVADPADAVNYFTRVAGEHPDRIDLQRGLAKSLVRAGQPENGAKVWTKVIAMPGASNDDRVSLAEAQIRAGDWKAAQATLAGVPPTHETFDRYRIEAMVADANKQWAKADSFYETAVGMTTRPAGVLNNWGFSKLSRSDAKSAERLFGQALTYDPDNFTAKNNLVLARAAQRKYDLPVIEMTQTERAKLLYTAALSAIKQGDVTIGKGLMQDAVDTSPVYFDEAARALEALTSKRG